MAKEIPSSHIVYPKEGIGEYLPEEIVKELSRVKREKLSEDNDFRQPLGSFHASDNQRIDGSK